MASVCPALVDDISLAASRACPNEEQETRSATALTRRKPYLNGAMTRKVGHNTVDCENVRRRSTRMSRNIGSEWDEPKYVAAGCPASTAAPCVRFEARYS